MCLTLKLNTSPRLQTCGLIASISPYEPNWVSESIQIDKKLSGRV